MKRTNQRGGFRQETNQYPSFGPASWTIAREPKEPINGITHFYFTDGRQTVRVHSSEHYNFPTAVDNIHGDRLNNSTFEWDSNLHEAAKTYITRAAREAREAIEAQDRARYEADSNAGSGSDSFAQPGGSSVRDEVISGGLRAAASTVQMR